MTPVKSPHSGKETGYEPERCYWTADGKPKPEPTYVLLNAAVGKPGPTFCQDCKRLVVGLNPPAGVTTRSPVILAHMARILTAQRYSPHQPPLVWVGLWTRRPGKQGGHGGCSD